MKKVEKESTIEEVRNSANVLGGIVTFLLIIIFAMACRIYNDRPGKYYPKAKWEVPYEGTIAPVGAIKTPTGRLAGYVFRLTFENQIIYHYAPHDGSDNGFQIQALDLLKIQGPNYTTPEKSSDKK